MEKPMAKRLEINWLLDFYGPLLTGRRQTLARLYCEEDLSLSEIAQQTGITRQGVHDALQKAQAQLEGYERKLGLLNRYRRLEQAMAQCHAQLERVKPAPGSEEALSAARESLSRIEWIER